MRQVSTIIQNHTETNTIGPILDNFIQIHDLSLDVFANGGTHIINF